MSEASSGSTTACHVLRKDLGGTRLNTRESGDWDQHLITWQVLAELHQVCTKGGCFPVCVFLAGLCDRTVEMSWVPQGMLRGSCISARTCEGEIRQKGKQILSHESIGKQSGHMKTIDSLPV